MKKSSQICTVLIWQNPGKSDLKSLRYSPRENFSQLYNTNPLMSALKQIFSARARTLVHNPILIPWKRHEITSQSP